MTTTEQDRRYGTIEDFNRDNFDKRYVFVLNHQNPKPSIEGRHFPNSYSLKLEDSILDPATKKNRIIRVVDGETSIYKDEQSGDGQKREPKRVMFSPKGDFIVEGAEKLTLEWFFKSNKNGSNKLRRTNDLPKFYLLDLKRGLDEQMEKDKSEAEAMTWCYQAEFKHVLRYARVLGLDIDKDPEEIRWNLRNLAKKDSKKFMDGLKNKYTTRKFYVLEAADKGLITVDTSSNTISWASGNLISVAPMGSNPVDYFVDLSISKTDMDMTYRTLQELVEPTKQPTTHTAPPPQVVQRAEEINTPIASGIEDLIKQSIEKGVITQKKSWYFFKDKKFQGKKLAEALTADAHLLDQVKNSISEKALA